MESAPSGAIIKRCYELNMAIAILSIAQKNPAWVDAAVQEYSQRCVAPFTIEQHIVSLMRRIPGQEHKAIDKESAQCLKQCKANDFVIGLDPAGHTLDSYQFADKIQKSLDQGRRPVFIIGAPEGLSQSIRQRCDVFWSLSQMTMPHTLAKVVLAEQLYRAWSIMNQHPYHRQ